MKKFVFCMALSLSLGVILSGCSKEEINHALFIDKIIEKIDITPEESPEIVETEKVIETEEKVEKSELENSDLEEKDSSDLIKESDRLITLDWEDSEIDLDFIILSVDSNNKIKELISYKNMDSVGIVHMGEKIDGTESIYLDLENLSTKLVFCVYNRSNKLGNIDKLNLNIDGVLEKKDINILSNISSKKVELKEYFGDDIELSKISAIVVGSYERIGTFWEYKKGNIEFIEDFNSYLGERGYSTIEYGSEYLEEQARLEQERLEEEKRLEEERKALENESIIVNGIEIKPERVVKEE